MSAIIGYCVPWPYIRGDDLKPATITKAAWSKACDTVIVPAMHAAFECTDAEQIKQYDIFQLEGVSRPFLDELIEHGLVHLEVVSNGAELKTKLNDIHYRMSLAAINGRRQDLLDMIAATSVHNKEILGS